MDQKARLEEIRQTVRDLAESHPKARASIIDYLAQRPKAPLVAELPNGPGWDSLCSYYWMYEQAKETEKDEIDYLSITREVSV